MAQKRETKRQRKIREALEAEFPKSKWFKVHGGPFMEAGLPDLIGAVEGMFFGFEVKEEDGELSRIQEDVIKEYQAGGNVACAIEAPDEAIAIVRATLRAAARRRRGSRLKRWLRAVVRAAYWQDVDSRRGHRKTTNRGRAGRRI